MCQINDITDNEKQRQNTGGLWIEFHNHVSATTCTISTKKTMVVYQPAPGKPYSEPRMTVKGQTL